MIDSVTASTEHPGYPAPFGGRDGPPTLKTGASEGDTTDQSQFNRHSGATSGVRSLLSLTRANERLGRAISGSLGFGLQELNALIHISEAGRLTPTDIARCLDLPRPTVTALIDKLERTSLAVRCRDSMDRRKVYVVLTDTGEAAIRWTHAQWRAAFRAVGAEDIPHVLDDLTALTNAILDQASAIQGASSTQRVQ